MAKAFCYALRILFVVEWVGNRTHIFPFKEAKETLLIANNDSPAKSVPSRAPSAFYINADYFLSEDIHVI